VKANASRADRARVVRHLAAVSWRVDRVATAAVLLLSVGLAFATSGLALSQRWIVDGLRHPGGAAPVLAIVVGALSQVLWVMGTRLRNTFRSGVISKIDVELAEEVVADVARVPGIEHLERADYLDRVYLAVRGTYSLGRVQSSTRRGRDRRREPRREHLGADVSRPLATPVDRRVAGHVAGRQSSAAGGAACQREGCRRVPARTAPAQPVPELG
jgi:hypothetical protein